jgi:tetratricopeptide (TPR) repeat protein
VSGAVVSAAFGADRKSSSLPCRCTSRRGCESEGGDTPIAAGYRDLSPHEAAFYFFLADAYRQTERNDRAALYYEEALRRRPDFLPARLNYAAALSKMDRKSAAAQALEIAAKTAPRDPAILNKLGETYLDLDKTEQAMATLQRALNNDPDLAEAYLNLGDVYLRKGDPKAAGAALRSAIRLRPGSAPAHNNLANILQTAGDFAQAEYHFKTSIALDPEYPAVHYNYGRALAAKGMLEQGEAEFEAALRLIPILPKRRQAWVFCWR